ncbi:Dipeptidyl aminopeptidase/acylaminoacyl peptidase [Saccharicrinis carchari]|uniref:Dipeptidyl aminopeptidase/acylaminoacyl peptidase n=1 Tax=Saccharicrinis carchari TaxID=1168039 RepID=A0A521EU66_SACCC|nr:prolyl oligopeptidase family serine peptidase [Saccharicrinis carchari]SMO87439.1 Dipeptidyl aminopeptidase/acylaminoacyl peptidase [Saccharicrinis carchari]
MIKITLTFLLLAFTIGTTQSQNKKALSVDDYDIWKSLRGAILSNNGKWVSYQINPQKGDGYLYLYNTENQQLDSVARGTAAVFSPENNFLAFKVVPQADTVRTLKLKKTKDEKMPKDTLVVWNLISGEKKSYPRIKNFTVPKKKGDWLVAHFHKKISKEGQDTDSLLRDSTHLAMDFPKTESTIINNDSTTKKKKTPTKFKSKGTQLVYLNPINGDSISFADVVKYSVPKYGEGIFVVQSVGDSIEETKIKRLATTQLKTDSLFHKQGNLSALSCDDHAGQLGFLFSPDTAKTKTYRLYHWLHKKNQLNMVVDTMHPKLPQGWSAHTKGKLWFSEKGDKLFFGSGKRPSEEAKDTLLKSEKVFVDIWNWKDKRLQPMQKKNLNKDKDRAYKAVYLIKPGIVTQLETETFNSVSILEDGNWDYAVVTDDTPYLRASSWSGVWAKDFYRIDLASGERSLIQKKIANKYSFSPDGDFLCWYNPTDSTWYLNNLKNNTKTPISNNIELPFYNELNDVPNSPRAYGVAGWSPGSSEVYIYDRFDIWKFDTRLKNQALNLTQGMGRQQKTRFRYVNLDKDNKYINEKEGVLLHFLNEENKNQGYGWLKNGSWESCIHEPANFSKPIKAKNSDQMIWRKGDFRQYPELYYSTLQFTATQLISNTNPQQSLYNWGNIQLINYNALDGKEYQGLLVTPENLDRSKKYPMIVYYYERDSERLHRYYSPAPSRSTVNWTMYASNGYVLFIPDIAYRTGDPGLSAYEAIMGGVMSVTQRFDFIDSNNIGLQGQSWGGYQTAHMITRTNMFKAAMAGAPVSNMTSAYGGIRWGTGSSRMFQYERTQSRIGGTLWDKFTKYVENSPVFYVPQIETPLLMMHNDNDGAVPWYQGIEMFVAMRRLNKPVWMLTYNDEEHNLTRRANSIDLSIRMRQFFDHYLKGKPAPVWMEHGIPAVEKGHNMGYDLVE